jgi:hypothetical protein
VSICKAFINGQGNVQRVLDVYLSDEKPTVEAAAKQVGTTHHTVMWILRHHLDPQRFKDEKMLRYSRSKMGPLNPMTGKTAEQHHNWIGDVSDDKGYLTMIVDGERYFKHRIVFAEMLGIHVSQLPESLVIHHIDLNPLNNDPNNLAAATITGHAELHAKRTKLQKLPLWGQWLHGTSKSKGTIPIAPKG